MSPWFLIFGLFSQVNYKVYFINDRDKVMDRWKMGTRNNEARFRTPGVEGLWSKIDSREMDPVGLVPRDGLKRIVERFETVTDTAALARVGDQDAFTYKIGYLTVGRGTTHLCHGNIFSRGQTAFKTVGSGIQ